MLEDYGYHPLLPLDIEDEFLCWAGSESEILRLINGVHPEFVEHELEMMCCRKRFPDVNPIIPTVYWSSFDHLLVRSHDELYDTDEESGYEGSVEGASTPQLHDDGGVLLSDLSDEEMFEVDPQVLHRNNTDVFLKHFYLCDALESEGSEDRELEQYEESKVAGGRCDPFLQSRMRSISQSSGVSDDVDVPLSDNDKCLVSEDEALSNGCQITAGIVNVATGEIFLESDSVAVKESEDQHKGNKVHNFPSEEVHKAQGSMKENLVIQLPLKSIKLCPTLSRSDVLSSQQKKDREPAGPKMAKGRRKKQKSSKPRKSSVSSEDRVTTRSGWCLICKKQLKRLDKHNLIHIGSKPHKCPHCLMQFRQSEHLKRHLNKHSGDRSKFECKGCSKWLTRKDKLKDHQTSCRKWKELCRISRL